MKIQLTTREAADLLYWDEYANFSPEGALALVEYLENLEDDLGVIDFDKVAIRCEFSEYRTEEEALEEYDIGTIEELEDETTVIKVSNGGVIVAGF